MLHQSDLLALASAVKAEAVKLERLIGGRRAVVVVDQGEQKEDNPPAEPEQDRSAEPAEAESNPGWLSALIVIAWLLVFAGLAVIVLLAAWGRV